jgi:hypothetical protein
LTRSLSLDREENGHHHERNLTHLQVVNVMACEWGIRQAKTTTIATLKYCDYDHGLNFLVIFSGHLFVISVTSLLFSSTRVQHHFVNPCTSSMAILRLGPVFATSRSGRRASAFRFSPYKRPLKQALPTKPLSKPELCTEEESHHRNSNRNDMDGGIQVPQGRLFLNDFEKIDPGSPLSDPRPWHRSRTFLLSPRQQRGQTDTKRSVLSDKQISSRRRRGASSQPLPRHQLPKIRFKLF